MIHSPNHFCHNYIKCNFLMGKSSQKIGLILLFERNFKKKSIRPIWSPCLRAINRIIHRQSLACKSAEIRNPGLHNQESMLRFWPVSCYLLFMHYYYFVDNLLCSIQIRHYFRLSPFFRNNIRKIAKTGPIVMYFGK
jgi:hypothetical protein